MTYAAVSKVSFALSFLLTYYVFNSVDSEREGETEYELQSFVCIDVAHRGRLLAKELAE
jgi:hypothetical protein